MDYLQNFVDIHNHILPGIDDGAKNVQESIDLIRGFKELGITNLVATPHIMSNLYPNTKETIEASMDLLTNELIANYLKDISIEAAAEHMIDDNFEDILERGEVMPMRKQYLLVEMSFLQASINFDDAIQSVMKKGLFPVLAHPERYGYWHSNKANYSQYKKKGVQYQLNLLSLSDYYGAEVQKMALYLLDHGLCDYIASDIHRLEQLEALKEIKIKANLLESIIPIINNTITNFY
ncbi:CpsB/CapC family capsule biosynthesis tyrosine phosphatase [Eudoraea sp.]|uniref:tyrosine-protein phosphatase n=1 Tax=Eudoraea sp. TaxID=1979955 RepID=UPI0032675A08